MIVSFRFALAPAPAPVPAIEMAGFVARAISGCRHGPRILLKSPSGKTKRQTFFLLLFYQKLLGGCLCQRISRLGSYMLLLPHPGKFIFRLMSGGFPENR